MHWLLIWLATTLHESNKEAKNKSPEKVRRVPKSNEKLQSQIYCKVCEAIAEEFDEEVKKGLSEKEATLKLFARHQIPTKEELENTDFKYFLRETDIDGLCKMITRKEMYRLGYDYSTKGNDLGWKEKEQQEIKNRETARRHPWL